jgi:hypothetical protein
LTTAPAAETITVGFKLAHNPAIRAGNLFRPPSVQTTSQA